MNIYPLPKCLVWNDGAFVFGSQATMQVNCALREDRKELLCTLWNRFSFTASVLTVLENGQLTADTAVIGEGSVPALSSEDEYAVLVTPKGVGIAARGETGLMHAMYSLIQVIDPINLDYGEEKLEIPAMEIHDHPSIGLRSVHLCVFPETSLTLIKKAISLAGLLKCGSVVLEFWGTLRYDVLPELCWPGHAYSKEQVRPLISLANAFGMEVIPMFNHLGHAAQARECMGRHTMLSQNPRLATLFEQDGWTWCLSNPRSHELLHAIREELIDLCGEGGYFHLGCDEAYSFATCRRCADKDGVKMLIDYLNGLAEELDAHGRRGIIWADQFLERSAWLGFVANSKPAMPTHLVLEKLDKRLIMADWQYDRKEGPIPTAEHLKKHGFTTLVCPWDDNSHKNVRCLTEAAVAQDFDGVMLTTWNRLPEMLRDFAWDFSALWNGTMPKDGRSWFPSACLLRKLMPAGSRYEDCGFLPWEAEDNYSNRSYSEEK